MSEVLINSHKSLHSEWHALVRGQKLYHELGNVIALIGMNILLLCFSLRLVIWRVNCKVGA